MATYILLALVFFLPFLVYKVGISSFEIPKVLVFEILVSVLSLFAFTKNKQLSIKNFKTLPYLLLASLFTLSLIHALGDPKYTFFGNLFRLQGVFLLWCLMLFAIFTAKTELGQKYKKIYLISFVGIFASAFLYNFNLAGRAIGTLGEPNALAAVAVVVFTFVYFNYNNKVRLPAFLFLLAILYVTRSRSATIALGIEAIFACLVYYKINLSKAIIVALSLVALSLSTPFLGSLNTLGSTLSQQRHSFEDRGDIWLSAAYAGLESPIYGVGFGNIQNSLKKAATELEVNAQYAVVDSSHNFLLDYWIAGGVIGIAIILSLIYMAIENFIEYKRILELCLLLATITVMLFNPVSIIVLIVFWWLLGRGLFGGLISKS